MRLNRTPRALLLLAVVCLLVASPALAAPDRDPVRREADRPTLTEVVTDVVLSIWERVLMRLTGDEVPHAKTPRTPGAGVDPDGWRPRGG